jgi:hypothetical protein
VFHYYGLLIRNRVYIEFETLKKQCWSYLRNIKRAINYFFYKRLAQNLAKFLLSKNLAEHWDLPNTGIFYSKDVASGYEMFANLLCTVAQIYTVRYTLYNLTNLNCTVQCQWHEIRTYERTLQHIVCPVLKFTPI